MTFLIILITAVISIVAFNNRELFFKFQFNSYQVFHRKQYYRLLSHGFVHVGWGHLLVNMFVLFFFGSKVEAQLNELALQGVINHPTLVFIFLYLSAIVFSSSISLFKHKDNHYYNAVGASGAVAAILFFSIFFSPWDRLLLYAVIPIPGIIFGIAYIAYSQYMGRRGQDNIGHDAHLLGAVFGFLFPLFLDLALINHFINHLLNF